MRKSLIRLAARGDSTPHPPTPSPRKTGRGGEKHVGFAPLVHTWNPELAAAAGSAVGAGLWAIGLAWSPEP